MCWGESGAICELWHVGTAWERKAENQIHNDPVGGPQGQTVGSQKARISHPEGMTLTCVRCICHQAITLEKFLWESPCYDPWEKGRPESPGPCNSLDLRPYPVIS
jgi:hypothetical protein